MPGGVEEYPEMIARLKLGLASPESHHLRLGQVEIGNVEVEVRLLGLFHTRPLWRGVVKGQLEGDRRTPSCVKFNPALIVAADWPAGDG